MWCCRVSALCFHRSVCESTFSVCRGRSSLSLSSTTGTETGVAEQVKGQPLEPAGGGRETFRRSVEAVRRGQAGSRETGAEW